MKTIFNRGIIILFGIIMASEKRHSSSFATMQFPTEAKGNDSTDKMELGPVRDIDPDKPMVALTFDDGPSPRYTPTILDVLKENGATATFFVLGIEAEKNKDLLTRIIDEGNEIGNHSFDHKNYTLLSDEELNYQIDTTEKIIEEATGYIPSIIRTPYGFVNDDLIKKIDYPIILWSLDTLDWENRNAETIYNNIIENVKDGEIILMHDTYESSADAVKLVIPELIKRGYQLVTISELSEYRGIPLQPGNVYSNMYP